MSKRARKSITKDPVVVTGAVLIAGILFLFSQGNKGGPPVDRQQTRRPLRRAIMIGPGIQGC